MLSDADLEAMRTDLEVSLPDTATVQRRSRSSDSMGGSTVAWPTVATVACRIAPRQGVEGDSDGHWQTTDGYRITVPWDADIRPTDRLIVGPLTVDVSHVSTRGEQTIARVVAAFEVAP